MVTTSPHSARTRTPAPSAYAAERTPSCRRVCTRQSHGPRYCVNPTLPDACRRTACSSPDAVSVAPAEAGGRGSYVPLTVSKGWPRHAVAGRRERASSDVSQHLGSLGGGGKKKGVAWGTDEGLGHATDGAGEQINTHRAQPSGTFASAVAHLPDVTVALSPAPRKREITDGSCRRGPQVRSTQANKGRKRDDAI
jgi:hypothetical protein